MDAELSHEQFETDIGEDARKRKSCSCVRKARFF